MTVGQNTVSGEMLRSYVARIERLAAEKRELGTEIAAIYAEAKAEGFTSKAIRACVKIRAMKPHDRQEDEAMLDMYLHALGMETEPPLFRFAGLAAIDTTARDQVIDHMKQFVPAAGLGKIEVTMGGVRLRLERDRDGDVRVDEVEEAPAPEKKSARRPSASAGKEDPPAVDGAGAFDLGKQFAADNRPVIDNPFPYGDPRRARFDAGWRAGSGSDGMGPDRGE